jgi:hypothetical protein
MLSSVYFVAAINQSLLLGRLKKFHFQKIGCNTSCRFVIQSGKDFQYSPLFIPACTRSRSNFQIKAIFIGRLGLFVYVCDGILPPRGTYIEILTVYGKVLSIFTSHKLYYPM